MKESVDFIGFQELNEKKRKGFIGGAEAARRKARKQARKPKKATDKKNITLKIKNTAELFYTSLLKSNVRDLLHSNEDNALRSQVLTPILQHAGLPPISKLPASYHDSTQYYSMKASLLLEEARCQISQSLMNLRMKKKSCKNSYSGFTMTLLDAKKMNKSGNVLLTFEKIEQNNGSLNRVESFTPQEMYNMKPGCLHEIILLPQNQRGHHHDCFPSAITYIKPEHDFGRSQEEDTNPRLKLVLCNCNELLFPLKDNSTWQIVPLTTLINCQRQFEGCMRYLEVPFMSRLLAWPDRTHIRYNSDGEEEINTTDSLHLKKGSHIVNKQVESLMGSKFPKLNPTQERAASAFLNSSPSTLTLVQGPPGTGKTTFLVSLIYRNFVRVEKSKYDLNKRVMVTAPTNRAITVLANRFLDAVDSNCSLNLVLIGVEDKLMDENTVEWRPDDRFTESSLSPSLRSIYVYTWLKTVIQMYSNLVGKIPDNTYLDNNLQVALNDARILNERLQRSIPSLFEKSLASKPCQQLITVLEDAVFLNKTKVRNYDRTWQLFGNARQLIHTIISCLKTISRTSAVSELLDTANIIFSTLSTAGTSFVKSTTRIDDLFIDEASAAGEAEICIPFHLLPNRMLAVGDPKQLPVTILSKDANKNGLGKSLHERLLYDCGKEHIMLDVQYRMKPAISYFPSKQFYEGKISNGANVSDVNYKCNSQILEGLPYGFYNVIGQEQRSLYGSYFNLEEANKVVALVSNLAATASTCDWHSAENIRIITFYQGQVLCIRNLLRQMGFGQVLVATVDSSQGSEANIIIISFVRSSDRIGSKKYSTAGFLADDRRLNVALTRAKHQLVCIGNALSLAYSGVPSLKSLIDDLKDRKLLYNCS